MSQSRGNYVSVIIRRRYVCILVQCQQCLVADEVYVDIGGVFKLC